MPDEEEKPVPRSLKCCCCRTTTAAKVVACIDIVFMTVAFIYTIYVLIHYVQYESSSMDDGMKDIILTMVGEILAVLIALFMFYGVSREYSCPCLLYVIWKALVIVGLFARIVWLYANHKNPGVIFVVVASLVALLCLYQMATAAQCYHWFVNKNKVSPEEETEEKNPEVAPLPPPGWGYAPLAAPPAPPAGVVRPYPVAPAPYPVAPAPPPAVMYPGYSGPPAFG